MDRAIPEGNRVVHSRTQKLNKLIHKEKIKQATKGISNEVPFSLQNPGSRRSKEFIIEGKPAQTNTCRFRKMHRNRAPEPHALGEDEQYHPQ